MKIRCKSNLSGVSGFSDLLIAMVDNALIHVEHFIEKERAILRQITRNTALSNKKPFGKMRDRPTPQQRFTRPIVLVDKEDPLFILIPQEGTEPFEQGSSSMEDTFDKIWTGN